MKASTQGLVLFSLLLAVGCADQTHTSHPPSGQVISSPKSGTAGTGYGVTGSEADRALESQLRQTLQNGSLSSVATGVNVTAQNGTVTLTGSVPSENDRLAVDTLVRNTTGVTSVMDQLQISGTSGQGQVASSQPGTYANPTQSSMEMDRALADRVKDALRNNANTGSMAPNINVSAQNGSVTLTGTVPNDQQRQMVDNLVRNVTGVSSVYDQMQIAAAPTGRSDQQTYPSGQAPQPGGQLPPQGVNPSPTLATGDVFNLHVQGLNDTDRALAQNILQGLRTDTILHSLLPTVNINVAGGRVILQGNVQSEQQKQAIASVVQRAAGASNVENQLQVTGQ
jgi:osmotically-inducible protein OsmY